MRKFISSFLIGFFTAISATGEEPLGRSSDNPVQQSNVMDQRPLANLTADLPGGPDSPVTVDPITIGAGNFEIELGVLSYSKDRNDGGKFDSWTWAETNVIYGLSDSVDLQLAFTPYIYETTRENGEKEVSEGFGDITLRFKWNLWGNDEGNTAFAVFPYLKIPTGTDVSNDEWEGGIVLPFAMDVNDQVGIGLQAELANAWNEDEGEHDLDFSHTAALGIDVSDQFGIYLEYIGVAGDHPYEAYASTGITWVLNEIVEWDTGVVLGLNDAAEDLNVYTGFVLSF